MSTFYNVGSADITNGLIDYEISSGQDYFILLSAPSNANIQIRLNENTAPLIPIKEHWQFKSADVKKIFITSDAIAGEHIKWGQADGNLEITTNPTINAIDTISQMGVTFAEQMDKIINPYELPEIISGKTSSTSLITMLNTLLDCDKVVITLTIKASSTSYNGANSWLACDLDDTPLIAICSGNGSGQDQTLKHEFIGIRGKNIKILSDIGGLTLYNSFHIEKYNLKD